MTLVSQIVYLVKQPIDSELQFLRPLLFPEYSRLINGEKIPGQLEKRLQEIVEHLPNAKRFRHTLSRTPDVGAVRLVLPPVKRQLRELRWTEPIEIEFHYLSWVQGTEATVVYVPSLDIEVVLDGKPANSTENQVRTEILNCLHREQHLMDLSSLFQFSRFDRPEVVPVRTVFTVPTPKDEAIRRSGVKTEDAETLKTVCTRIGRGRRGEAVFEMDDLLTQMSSIIYSVRPQSLLLVGPSGSGKTALVNQLARRVPESLPIREFWETSGSRIVSGMTGFGQWQERCDKLVKDLQGRNAVVHLGNLFELANVGKSVNQHRGIATYLRPHIQRGGLLATVECLPDQITLLEKEDPQLLRTFARLEVQKPDSRKLTLILKQRAGQLTSGKNLSVKDSAIEAIRGLHDRYATYSAMPGRPLRFLENLIDDSSEEESLDAECAIQKFSAETGLPYFLLSQIVPLEIDKAREWFSTRVIGQPDPVELVVNMLAAVKANLTPKGRPIASFLFIGPTGVGKTEMAKSIAEFMFDDPQKMVRFDMTEYSSQLSVDRLIGGIDGKEGLLTSRVRQNPFTVLLLDEFEKAHPVFFDLLLQVLGEGRLTDSRGRIADFSTSIIIMTSNLGAENLNADTPGFGNTESLAARAKEHFTSEVQKFVRPELYNRIDRVVPFDPLDEETIRLVTGRAIDKLCKREGLLFRPIQLQTSEEAVRWIAKKGHDPRYGARPIHRYIQDHLVVPLATGINQSKGDVPSIATVTIENDELSIRVENKSELPYGTESNSIDSSSLNQDIMALRAQRRRSQALHKCSLANRVRNESYRIRQQHARQLKRREKLLRRKVSPQVVEAQNRDIWKYESELQRFQSVLTEIDGTLEQARTSETDLLVSLDREEPVDRDALQRETNRLRKKVNEAIFSLFVFEGNAQEQTTILLFGRKREFLSMLLNCYRTVAEARGYPINYHAICKHDPNASGKLFTMQRELTGAEKLDQEEQTARQAINDPNTSGDRESGDTANRSSAHTSLDLTVADVYPVENPEFEPVSSSPLLGIALTVSGLASFPVFAVEKGIHHFRGEEVDRIYVQVIGEKLVAHRLPSEVATQGPYERDEKCRAYHLKEKTITDSSNRKFGYQNLAESVSQMIESSFQNHLESIIESWN